MPPNPCLIQSNGADLPSSPSDGWKENQGQRKSGSLRMHQSNKIGPNFATRKKSGVKSQGIILCSKGKVEINRPRLRDSKVGSRRLGKHITDVRVISPEARCPTQELKNQRARGWRSNGSRWLMARSNGGDPSRDLREPKRKSRVRSQDSARKVTRPALESSTPERPK